MPLFSSRDDNSLILHTRPSRPCTKHFQPALPATVSRSLRRGCSTSHTEADIRRGDVGAREMVPCQRTFRSQDTGKTPDAAVPLCAPRHCAGWTQEMHWGLAGLQSSYRLRETLSQRSETECGGTGHHHLPLAPVMHGHSH